MCFFYIILRQFAVVRHFSLCDMVFTVGLLQKQIAAVFFIFQYTANRPRSPYATALGRNAHCKQFVCNCVFTHTTEKVVENHSYDLRFFGNNDKRAIIAAFITEHCNAAEPPLFKILADTPLLVFACGVTFLLCIRA